MDSKEIDKILRLANLEPRLAPSNKADSNPWFFIMERDLSLLCENLLSTPAHFTFNVSNSVQAWAIYSRNLVVMTAGMFKNLCLIAHKVATSNALLDSGGGLDKARKKNFNAPSESIFSEFSKRDFNWDLERTSWESIDDREILFFYTLQNLSRFVVLHELGHIHHNHGARFKGLGISRIEIDSAHGELSTIEEGVAAQAREIVADNFAFIQLQKIQEHELSTRADTALAKLLSKELLKDEKEKIRFLLTTAYLYFHMMDRLDWHSLDIFKLTHPPAPFRLKNIFALTLEQKSFNLREGEIEEIIAHHNGICKGIISLAYSTNPDLDIFKSVESSKFDELFNLLYKEHPKWQRPNNA